MSTIYTGSGVAIVTPFVEGTNAIDWDAFRDLLDFHLEFGTDAIIVAGTTGESATMSDDEQIEIIQFAIDHVAGRVPVIAGTGINDTMHSVYLSQAAEKAGADALLVVTPYYLKTSPAGMIAHFTTIANSVNIPIILYHVPGRTGAVLTPDQVAELAKIENIVALKDAVGDLEYTKEVIAKTPENFAIYSGNDDLNHAIMQLGGKGAISVTANVMPKEVHELLQLNLEGKVEEAAKLNEQLAGINNDLFIEVNPIPVKYITAKLGYHSLAYRLPLVPPAEETQNILDRYVAELRDQYGKK